MKLISVVTACYNEEDNIAEVYKQVKDVFSSLPQYKYEHIFIDNASDDKTVAILKNIAKTDSNVKIIVNNRNFGHIRSPVHALLQAHGDAIISIVADLQDPIHLIKEFLLEWESGYKIVVGIKKHTHDPFIMRHVRKFYYRFITRISRVQLVKDFTGFGLYDKTVMNAIRDMDDPYPYFRGAICEIGCEIKQIPYIQPGRRAGITKNNFSSNEIFGVTNFKIFFLLLEKTFEINMSQCSLFCGIKLL